jgi:hypothetical protein
MDAGPGLRSHPLYPESGRLRADSPPAGGGGAGPGRPGASSSSARPGARWRAAPAWPRASWGPSATSARSAQPARPRPLQAQAARLQPELLRRCCREPRASVRRRVAPRANLEGRSLRWGRVSDHALSTAVPSKSPQGKRPGSVLTEAQLETLKHAATSSLYMPVCPVCPEFL